MTPDEVLATLDPDQRAVATAPSGPVAALAGAGSGKTRALTHRIAYQVLSGQVRADRVLPVAFTTRAAGEMAARLRGLGVAEARPRTFHAAALAQVRFFWPLVAGGQPPRLLPRKRDRLAEAARTAGFSPTGADLSALGSAIERAKVMQVAAEDYPAVMAPAEPGDATADRQWSSTEVAAVYAAYEAAKEAAGEMDFEDCLLLAVALLEEDQRAAERVRESYRSFVVDEYQDVNPLQQRLLEVWLGDRDDLCVVGDAAQSIYSFTGATPQFLLAFRQRYPNATVLKLERDYRSTPQIVRSANRLLRGSTVLTLRSERAAGPEVAFVEYEDEAAELAGIAEQLADRSGATAAETAGAAVLLRTNAQVDRAVEALLSRGIAVAPSGTERWFNRPEIRRALIRLRGLRLTQPDLAAAAAALEALLADGYSEQRPQGSGLEVWSVRTALLRLADGLGPDAGVDDLITELEYRDEQDAPPPAEGVAVLTLHAAKGLEWEKVYLPSLVDGVMPAAQAKTPEAVAEERRLLYVGITRARTQLQLSWWTRRGPGAPDRQRSGFLADLLTD